MENLLCKEELLRTPSRESNSMYSDPQKLGHFAVQNVESFFKSIEDCEFAIKVSLEKEAFYMPDRGYAERLRAINMVDSRIRAVKWILQSAARLSLSFSTMFAATNYLDRFISKYSSTEWRLWMMELLQVVCLSIAAKFDEVCIPSLFKIQMMDGLENLFDQRVLQKMELTVLKTLDWRLNAVTTYSFVDTFIGRMGPLHYVLHDSLTARVTEFVLNTLLDLDFLQFRASSLAACALRCALEELLPLMDGYHVSGLSSIIPQQQKDEIERCHECMELRLVDPLCSLTTSYCRFSPPSPVTVMTTEHLGALGFSQYQSRPNAFSLFQAKSSVMDPKGCPLFEVQPISLMVPNDFSLYQTQPNSVINTKKRQRESITCEHVERPSLKMKV
ncbi:putative cyclin-D7-1 [Amborella trichopoda]|uniref:putative cyclin-D7-1 n=1 Tax=Amborella trichopoda TaxID=13333 RepID=UPI0009BFBF82|nr:putative cyclin-D7-1 [Amborella trichopoda]|eukprot:XP_020524113.1 putative cyclin-D7-1 [Amborella trichopoda]